MSKLVNIRKLVNHTNVNLRKSELKRKSYEFSKISNR